MILRIYHTLWKVARGDFDSLLLFCDFVRLNSLFSLLPNTFKQVFGSDLCDVMIRSRQKVQVIRPLQDFLTLMQIQNPVRLRGW